MAKSENITQYRERLDRTLASPKLTNEGSLKSLVKNQILQSSGKDTEGCGEKVIEKRTAEVANFLDMLRSVSANSNDKSKAREIASLPEWKVKQDNEEFRVMYREGPAGSPFHTLLVEGYVDGPLDICLCISWESALYSKWWPQSTIPTFKILSCKSLQKIRNGEQISLVRVKVSWPLSTREAIVHYFLFEYFEDDLLVVLLNTVADSRSIDINTDGFNSEAIPEAKDVVRIGVVGGFALQKVTSERSYFRTIATMDVKLDFVPPSLINFMSRQLIGNGFRLYQKAVSSRFTTDEDFSKALKGSLYARIREALYSTDKSNGYLEEKEPEIVDTDVHKEKEVTKNLVIAGPEEDETTNNVVIVTPEENGTPNILDSSRVMDQKVDSGFHEVELPSEAQVIGQKTTNCEIEELKSDESKRFGEQVLVEKIIERPPSSGKRSFIISSDVEQALGTLEKVISMVRQRGFNSQTWSAYGFAGERTPKENNADKELKFLDVNSDLEAHVEVEKESTARKSSQESITYGSSICNYRQGGSNSFSKEVNHNRIAPVSPEQKLSAPSDTNTNQIDVSTVTNRPMEVPILNHRTENNKYSNGDANGFHKTSPYGGNKLAKGKRHRFCCFGMVS